MTIYCNSPVVDFDPSYFEADCPACLYATDQQDVRFASVNGMPDMALEVSCARCRYQIAVMKPANAEKASV